MKYNSGKRHATLPLPIGILHHATEIPPTWMAFLETKMRYLP